eukprot:Nitzschia sp. Nitz4//scaffold8_size234185//9733//12128//NITZ4_001229-RA/size234185-processed-gene-0.251-mRNA-1//1//CDS//3329559722//8073//frame0
MDIISRETQTLGYNKDEEHRLLLADEQKMVDIEHPHHNDVLCGRGVTTNRHPGNESFRSLVGLNKEVYVSSSKKEKMEISRSIVAAVRQLDPPGRFLEKDPNTGFWSDIGPKKAVEKTSQALRDGAANLRKRLSADLGDPDFLSDVFEIHIHEDGEKPKPKPNASTDIKPQGDETKESAASTKCKKLAEKLKVVKKAKPQHIKKGHRRTLSNPCVGSASAKANRKSPPVHPPSPMTRFGNSSYHHPPLTPQTPASIHPASHPNSPMTWGAGAPYHGRESPRTVGSAPLTYSPYEHTHPSPGVPTQRSYGGPQYLSSPSSHHHYYYSPSHEGSGPPYQPHSWSSYGYSAAEHSSEGGHFRYPSRRPPAHHQYPRHHHHPGMPTTHRPPRSSSPPRSPLPRGPLPPGRHQFSPAGYRGAPQYYDSPAHEAPHSEGINGEGSSWYPRSAPTGSEYPSSWRSPHTHPQYGSPAPSGYPTSCSSSSTSWLSVPSLGSEAKHSSKSHLSPRTLLTPRASAFSRTPEWPNPTDHVHFKPPTPSHLMKERYPDMDDSANRASPPGEEKKSEYEKDEFKGHFHHVDRPGDAPSPHSHTPTPVKMEAHTQHKSPKRESPPAAAADAQGKGSDFTPQAEEEDDAMDTPMTPVEDIAMSPIPLDREDPTTLMALPENILSLPISPCGPNDEAQAISA